MPKSRNTLRVLPTGLYHNDQKYILSRNTLQSHTTSRSC